MCARGNHVYGRAGVSGPQRPRRVCVTSSTYVLGEKLHSGYRTAVYRAVRAGTDEGVVLKVLDPKHTDRRDLDRLLNEYEIGRTLAGLGVIAPLALSSFEGRPALELEDFRGRSLDRFEGTPMPMELFLRLSTQIAGVVSAIHTRGLIHKDLKPHNILWNEETGELRIADFCIASRVPREPTSAGPVRLIEGSLPYVSPSRPGE